MKYYLFAAANLLAAVGGGLIFNKNIKPLDGIDFFNEVSLLAFLIGAASVLMLPSEPFELRDKNHPAINHALLVSIGMTPDEAHLWINKTIELHQSCGCQTGTAFMLAALLLYPLIWYWGLYESFSSVWIPVLLWFVFAFVAGGVGKLVGLLTARIRIRIRLRSIRSKFKENIRYV